MTEKLNMSLDDIIRLNKKITPKGAGGIRRPTGAKPSKLGLNKAGKVDFKKAAKMRAALQIPAHRTPRPTSVQNVDAATRRLVNNLVEQALQKRLSQPARPLVPAPPLTQVVSKPRVPIKYDTENFFEEDEEEDVMEVPPPPMIVRRVITQSVAPKLSVPEAIQRIVRARTLPSRIVRVSAPSRPKKVFQMQLRLIRLFSQTRHLSTKLLRNRERILYKDSAGAFKDLFRTTGAVLAVEVVLLGIFEEFGMPTPDIMYDIRRTISPDFDLFAEHGPIAEHNMAFSQRIRAVNSREVENEENVLLAPPRHTKFHGTI